MGRVALKVQAQGSLAYHNTVHGYLGPAGIGGYRDGLLEDFGGFAADGDGADCGGDDCYFHKDSSCLRLVKKSIPLSTHV